MYLLTVPSKNHERFVERIVQDPDKKTNFKVYRHSTFILIKIITAWD